MHSDESRVPRQGFTGVMAGISTLSRCAINRVKLCLHRSEAGGGYLGRLRRWLAATSNHTSTISPCFRMTISPENCMLSMQFSGENLIVETGVESPLVVAGEG